VEQNRKPGAPPTKDISDLKARLGLKRPEAGPGAAPGPTPAAAARPVNPGFPQAARPGGAPAPGAAPYAAAPQAAPAAPPAALDPYAGMRPQQGVFDLRTIDDGAPVQNVRSGRGKAAIAGMIVVGLAAFALGGGLGMASVGRANMNTANHAAKSVKGEVDSMQKTLTKIGTAVAMSAQRLAKDKKDPLAYDPALIAELSNIKLDPRPDTSKIFRVDYYRLPDSDVDRLFNYYYDSIALYNEVERHIKKTQADAESLKSYAEKSAAATSKNYGIVFDTSGKIIVGNLVEIGEQVCKNGGKDCGANDFVGFKVRSNTGAPFVDRKSGGKLEANNVVPLKPTPLMDAVMSGSTDQVRQEAYKQRTASIRSLVSRITTAQKELIDGLAKDAARPDVFVLF
jgi:hypothetical protein